MTTNDQPSNVGGGTLLQGTGWMYEGVDSEINKEEYLLGKKIGKNFEVEGTAGQINAVEYDVAPPSIFASRANHQVDLQRKLMEDPLVQIKKREVEDRKKLMDNPVKMKQLQDHLKSLEKKSKKSKKHKKEKKKKHKKGRGEDSDDENYRRIKREPESRRGEYRKEPESRRGEYKREPESRRGEYKREPESRRGDRDSKPPKKVKKRGRSSSDDGSDSDDADLDMKLLKKLQAMEKGAGVGSGSDSDEYESDDEAEERKKQALLAAGIDPNNIEAPMFSNTARKLGPENAPEKGKGDWDCLKCGNWNFVRRVECFKCNTRKGEGKAPAPAPLFVPIAITRIAKADPTPVLKKSRVTTNQQKEEGGKPEPGADSPPSQKEDGRPGDWRCKKAGCGYSNFASRSSCNKCSTAKGGDGVETPARAAYQRKEGRGASPSPPRRREASPARRGGLQGGLQAPAGRSAYRREPSRSPPPAHRRRSPDRKRSPAPTRKDETPTAAPTSKKLSDAEKQAKLAQMMANAEWRDEQRTSRVKKQRASQEREDADARREHDPGFLSRELKRAQEAQTMEGRIGANKHNIQRGHGDMDKNFARR